MGQEINLLENYPRSKRNVKERGATKTAEDRAIARQFGKEFFDGDRRHGYGGFAYNPRFWKPVVPSFIERYNLTPQSKILDVGCAKGFMMNDFAEALPGVKIEGIDISEYAVEHAMPSVKEHVQVADARSLPFEDDTFDLVISITTIHNLEKEDVIKALHEMQRVSKKDCFVTLDAYRNEAERELMEAWNLTAKTFFHVDKWKSFFKEIGYTGDYYWFIP